jgi:hypothetical protein
MEKGKRGESKGSIIGNEYQNMAKYELARGTHDAGAYPSAGQGGISKGDIASASGQVADSPGTGSKTGQWDILHA